MSDNMDIIQNALNMLWKECAKFPGIKYAYPYVNFSRLGGGVHILFGNGYGASIIIDNFASYGGSSGLYELAVMNVDPNTKELRGIDYSTPITNDVLGYLSLDDVKKYLRQIKKLPNRLIG